ncbi:MAG: FecR family protein [Chitinophagaceae bacterium]
MENNIDLNYLLRGHLAGSLSDQEKLLLIHFLDHRENLQKWNGLIGKLYEETAPETSDQREEDIEKMIRFILNYPVQKKSSPSFHAVRILKNVWLRYAAAILIFIGLGMYLYYNKNNQQGTQLVKAVPAQNDLPPGSHKATLTLSNGKKIELNPNEQQTIADGKLSINNKNGTLTYDKSAIVVYNTMSTPKGGQYKLTLPDGTKVWLNAASSITFPTSFPGNTRLVDIMGEVYFEVIKNVNKPFIVKTYRDEITVTGTSFNVNSYMDEPGIKTSLLEGSVHIKNILLKPGQAYTNGKITTTDLDQDMAWKNDVFNFHQVKLVDAMRQIARWYNVEVFYEGNFNDVELGGEIGRKLTLKQLLSGLQDRELHFKLDQKRLTVTQ